MRYQLIGVVCLIAASFASPAGAQQVPPITPDPCFVLGGGGINNPLQALQGTWGFKLEGFSLNPGSAFGATGAIGNFTFQTGQTTRSPVLQGIVTGIISANLNGTASPLNAPVNGNFQVLQNCSGGNISFGSGALPPGFRTVQFVFVNNFTQMYLLSVDNNGVILTGEAKKMF